MVPKLSAADHALAHCAAYLGAKRVRDHDDRRMVLAAVAEILPHVTRDHAHVEPLRRAMERLVAAPRDGTELTAEFFAAEAAADFHRWRASVGLDALRAEREGLHQ